MLTAAAYDIHREQLLARIRRFHAALSGAGIPYRAAWAFSYMSSSVRRGSYRRTIFGDVFPLSAFRVSTISFARSTIRV
jgi:hypothetical protein